VKKVFLLAAHFGRFRGLFRGGISSPQDTRGLSAQFHLRNLAPPAPPNFSRMSRTSLQTPPSAPCSFKRKPHCGMCYLLRSLRNAVLPGKFPQLS